MYSIIDTLYKDVQANVSLKSQVETLITLFLKYLKEPRYSSPLTISELSGLFQYFYKDLNSLIITSFTQSNSTKKQLIAASSTFNDNPKTFDYLLAISNYSTSSIKLLKRSDNNSLFQLRVFNYYKFLYTFQSIELAHHTLFNSSNQNEDSLYDKIFRFDEKDVIYQEFFEEKLDVLKSLDFPLSTFIEASSDESQKIIEFIDSLEPEKFQDIQNDLSSLKTSITPFSKMTSIVSMHKNLIKLFVKGGFKNGGLNNDVLLPTLIYLVIYKLDNKQDLYLNFVFIKNFLSLIDPYNIELFNVSLGSSYVPVDRSTKPISNKYRVANLFELLNLDESKTEPEILETPVDSDYEFFTNDHDLVAYILEEFLNNGAINYYLTNFEALVVYLSEITAGTLENSDALKDNKLFQTSVSKMVEVEMSSHFKFPDGELSKKATEKEKVQEKGVEKSPEKSRSRSSSLMNAISSKLTETRSRSNSSIMNSLKSSNISLSNENFPTLSTEADSVVSPIESDTNISLSMMKNILGRLGSVSVSQFRNPLEEVGDTSMTSTVDNNDTVSSATTLHRTSGSFLNRLSPNHSRTRSSSLEIGNNVSQQSKRNSITSKFTNGVSEFMTKLNTPATLPGKDSAISLPSPDNSNDTLDAKRPEYARSRTTSLQIMDKWFNNISNPPPRSPGVQFKDVDIKELTKFHGVELEQLPIKELRVLKAYYDQLCDALIKNSEVKESKKSESHDIKEQQGIKEEPELDFESHDSHVPLITPDTTSSDTTSI